MPDAGHATPLDTARFLNPPGLRLDVDSVQIVRDTATVATESGRPRPFKKETRKGFSDHLPITALLSF